MWLVSKRLCKWWSPCTLEHITFLRETKSSQKDLAHLLVMLTKKTNTFCSCTLVTSSDLAIWGNSSMVWQNCGLYLGYFLLIGYSQANLIAIKLIWGSEYVKAFLWCFSRQNSIITGGWPYRFFEIIGHPISLKTKKTKSIILRVRNIKDSC